MVRNFIPEKLYKKIINLLPICCVDLVVRSKNSFLLIKRAENPLKNKWYFPGGKILLNESLLSAVKRKLKEEVNIKKYKKIHFLGVQELKFKKSRFNKPIYSIANVFLVDLDKKDYSDVNVDKTSSGYKWFNKIQESFPPYLKKFLKLSGFK